MSPRKRTKMQTRMLAITAAVIFWLLCGLLPYLLLRSQYHDGGLYAHLYSHHFLYPLFFGLFAAYFIVTPFMATLRLIERPKRIWLIAVWLAFCVLASAIEYTSKNYAIWQIRPDALAGNPSLEAHLKSPSDAGREAFQNSLIALYNDSGNWSLNCYLYFGSFFIQTAVFLLIFLVIGLIAVFQATETAQRKKEFRPITISTTLAIFIGTFFLLMRLAYSAQKEKYYPAEALPAGDIAIIALYVGGYIYLCSVLWGWLQERLKAIVSLLFGGGVLTMSLSQELLVKLFGRDATLASYLALLGAAAFLLVPWMFLPKKAPSKPR